MLLNKKPLAALVALGLCANAYAADAESPATDSSTLLPKIQVTALTPRIDLTVPGTTSVITRQDMDRHLVTTIRDLIKYEPGVSVIGTAGRFGLDSFNIRGLNGNRTRIEIDGVSLPASFGASVAGSSFRAGRNYIDLDQISSVDIMRGPASVLYPSDSLGGMVELHTKDPQEYLKPGKGAYGSLKEQYDSADRSLSSTATVAGGDQRNALMVVINHREGHDTGNKGDIGGNGTTRTRPDPLHYNLTSMLGKYVHNADSGRQDRVIVDISQMHTETNSRSSLSSSVGYYDSQDTNSRARLSFGQWFPNLNAGIADTLDWNVYWQKSRTRTNTQTENATVQRFYKNLPIQEKIAGGKAVLVKQLPGNQTLSYGVELSQTRAESSVGGYGINKRTGAIGSTSAFLPGNYPLHLIPSSKTNRYAVFAQDRIELADDRLEITAGARAERYEYKPESDPLYQAYNPGFAASNYGKNRVTPKLGAIWHFNESLSAYANAAFGFRPPLYSEIAGSWNEQPIAGFNIAYLPNANLKSETSRGLELGLRGKGDAGWFNVAAYYNSYRNFIWSGYQVTGDAVPSWAYAIAPTAFMNIFYQSVNAKRAFIKGAEASGVLQLGYFNDALEGWSLHGSASITTGRLIEPGDTGYSPLNTVDPAKLVAGISYDARQWGAELTGTAVRRHSQLDSPSIFRPAGYGTLDLYAHYNPTDNLELNAGISNLTDRKYWDWGNLNSGNLGNLVSGNGLNDAGLNGIPADRLTMPGRTFSVSAKVTF